MNELKTFDDLEFKEHIASKEISEYNEKNKDNTIYNPFSGSLHAIIKFENGIKLSVVLGKLFYSNGVDTYEAWTGEGEPKGHLTKDEVTEYMKELQERK